MRQPASLASAVLGSKAARLPPQPRSPVFKYPHALKRKLLYLF